MISQRHCSERPQVGTPELVPGPGSREKFSHSARNLRKRSMGGERGH